MSNVINRIASKLQSQAPYSYLSDEEKASLFESSKLLKYRIGETLLRKDELPFDLMIVLDGKVRLLGNSPVDNDIVTLDSWFGSAFRLDISVTS